MCNSWSLYSHYKLIQFHCRYRERNDDLPVNPQSREAIPTIPNNLAVTTGGDRFLLHDSGFGDENRMIVFASDQALDLLKQSDHWLGDGTFSVSPSIFFQVCTASPFHHIRYLMYIKYLQGLWCLWIDFNRYSELNAFLLYHTDLYHTCHMQWKGYTMCIRLIAKQNGSHIQTATNRG